MLKYADDMVMLTESEEELNQVMREMDIALRQFNIKMNKRKTKVMVCSKKGQKEAAVYLDEQQFQNVESFCYLGSIITRDDKSGTEIRFRVLRRTDAKAGQYLKLVERVSNDKVLARIQEREETLWKYITKRRDTLIGHIVRHDGIMSTILEGVIKGKNAQGRPRLQYTPQTMQDMNCQTYQEFKRLAQNPYAWHTRLQATT
ncbi:hypothetical protein ILUMI_19914 [Ignelater luminosus]|uniref:Reverse transcriptase domain-containing protein n=1 Tax=Ignelater luminosus TaxID=2038154 RepID=A0A8K0G5D7_IGNLU|nr:hypothetical protein ILUMI_19914 [Ignelater luminosus]